LWPITIAILAVFLPRFVPSRDYSLGILAVGIPVMLAIPALKHRWRFAAVLAALFLAVPVGAGNGTLLIARRSFFGIHRVVRNPDGPFNDLYHGTTIHGRQHLAGSDLAPSSPRIALTYYHASGPIGQIIAQTNPRRIAVVGLGVGSLAAYADAKTTLVFYEIDPTVRWIAADSGYFTFIQSARRRGANVRIVLGDARLTLARAPADSYDLLVIDAFSGDAVPIHLLTREAMAIYRDRLAPGGLLAMHISNMYLNLQPVIAALAQDGGWAGLYCDDLELSRSQAAAGKFASQWVVLARDPSALSSLKTDPRWQPLRTEAGVPVWSDDFSNILSVFRWK
jgi:spermidine synthase